MFPKLVIVWLSIVGTTSGPSSRPSQEVEYLREFGDRARVRVIREVLVRDIDELLARQRADFHAAIAQQPATRQSFHGERTARFRVMYSPGPDLPERDLLVEHDWVIVGRRETYRTWAAERSDDNVLVLIYSSGESDHLLAIDLEPPAEPGFQPRPRLPGEPLIIPWGGRPTFLSAAVTGSLLANDLTVTIARRTEPARPRSATGGRPPAMELFSHRLDLVADGCRWVDATERP